MDLEANEKVSVYLGTPNVEILSGTDPSALLQGQVMIAPPAGGMTRLFAGADTSPGADVNVVLLGDFLITDFKADPLYGSYLVYEPAGDVSAPKVSSFGPADTATGVALSANVVLTFSEGIQRGTGNILLKTAAGAVVATYDAATSANLSISGSTLTINPTADLLTGTQYFVELTAGSIKDLAGNNYAGTTTYDFTTAVPQPLSKDDNFVAAQYASPAILGSGQGNDTYLLSSSLLSAGMSMTISDTQGANVVQLASGMAIASSRVGANALQLNLFNGSVVTVLGATTFVFEASGNASVGVDGPKLGYASFAQQVLGVAVPSDSSLNTGGAVLIDGATAIPPLPAGSKSDDFVVAQYASPAILGCGAS